MLGRIVKISIKDKNGIIRTAENKEYSFEFNEVKDIEEVNKLKKYDEVRFYQNKDVSIWKDEALSICKIIRIKDINKGYTTEEIIKEARRCGIKNIRNEHSFMTISELEKVLNGIVRQKSEQYTSNTRTLYSGKKENNIYKETDNMSIGTLIEKGYLVFIDTSSLMLYNALNTLNKEVIPFLKKFKKQIYVVDSVLHEVDTIFKKPTNNEYEKLKTHKQAESAKYILNILAKDNLCVTPETNSYNKKFADEELISCFTNYRTKYNLCLITNDNSQKKDGNLAGSIISLKNERTINGIKDIKVFSISRAYNDFKLIEFKQKCNSEISTKGSSLKRVVL